ncbi:MAG: DEAD/DEAH box helicase [Oscillospiraceae bacterium]|jgi:ATP-dependent RNA helicase DeaD|nr:DEAD/DEAH box helicase [Oscillospiraceae bacterium]
MSRILFKELLLSPEMYLAIDAIGFEETTEIQEKAIPIIMDGHDVLGKSQTGTGKTLAFSIPALEIMDPEKFNKVQVLVLCPTRELAVQATSEVMRLAKFKRGVHVADVYGGVPIDRQILKLKTANVVIGTPGRIMDHLKRRTLKLSDLKMIILDEADEMLSMGFRDDIEIILKGAPANRQTVLFSATMPPEILMLTKKFQKNPRIVEVNRKQATLENICQYYCNVPYNRKNDALKLILLYYDPKLSIIFCNTKRMVDCVTDFLRTNGFKAIGLHGDMQQNQRTNVMNSFKSGKTRILVATDVAARGIDVSNVNCVINFDIPQNSEYYVHRIGRTGRAGKPGESITICGGRMAREALFRICRLTKSKITQRSLPEIEEITKRQYENNLQFIGCELEKEHKQSTYHSMVKDLEEKGHELFDIAAAALRSRFEKQDEKIKNIQPIRFGPASDTSAVRRPYQNKSFSSHGKLGFSKILINAGRMNGVDRGVIARSIANATKISERELGRIEISERKTTVEIPKAKALVMCRQLRNFRINSKIASATLYQPQTNYRRY